MGSHEPDNWREDAHKREWQRMGVFVQDRNDDAACEQFERAQKAARRAERRHLREKVMPANWLLYHCLLHA